MKFNMDVQRDWESTNDLEYSISRNLDVREMSPLRREVLGEMLVICRTYRNRMEAMCK
jgi:hypothetical protein